MEANQNRIYVNLRKVEKDVVMSVSRVTDASRGLGLSCGGVLSAEQAGTSLVTIEYCQLKPAEFRVWFYAKRLDVRSFAERYGINVSQVDDWLGPK